MNGQRYSLLMIMKIGPWKSHQKLKDFVTIALFLDYKTAKSSGEEKEVYEGIKKASLIILDFLEVQIVDNPEEKKIQLVRKESSRVRDEKLAKEIWG